jgi:hypothetical protein
VRWATEDPSLEPLRTGELTRAEFAALVERYRPAGDEEKPEYLIGRWTREDQREDLEDDGGRVPERRRRDLKNQALGHLLLERPGYEAHRSATVTAKDSTSRMRIDALLQAEAPATPDVLVDLRVFATVEPRGAATLAERALGRQARYQALTARPAKVWLIVIADDEGTLTEQALLTALAGHGDATVLSPGELAALRRLPLPQ